MFFDVILMIGNIRVKMNIILNEICVVIDHENGYNDIKLNIRITVNVFIMNF